MDRSGGNYPKRKLLNYRLLYTERSFSLNTGLWAQLHVDVKTEVFKQKSEGRSRRMSGRKKIPRAAILVVYDNASRGGQRSSESSEKGVKPRKEKRTWKRSSGLIITRYSRNFFGNFEVVLSDLRHRRSASRLRLV